MTQSGNLVPRGLMECVFAFVVVRYLRNVLSRQQWHSVIHVLPLSARNSRDVFAAAVGRFGVIIVSHLRYVHSEFSLSS
jgi:hypothetical protein